MGREKCSMTDEMGYCGYYDAFYMLCEECQECPEGLDDDDGSYDSDEEWIDEDDVRETDF